MLPNYALKLTGRPRRAGHSTGAAQEQAASAAAYRSIRGFGRPARSLTLIR